VISFIPPRSLFRQGMNLDSRQELRRALRLAELTSRSLFRQGMNLDLGLDGPELRKALRLSRSLFRQGMNLD